MDAVLLAALARQWDGELAGGRLERVHAPEPQRLDLALRTRGGPVRIAFRLTPGEARCHLAYDSPPNPPAPGGFALFLRRHALGDRLLGARALPGERHLVLRLGHEDEVGRRELRELHFEAFGPRPNLVLVDGAGRIMDAFRRLAAVGEGGRALLPGLAYEPPAPRDKRDPWRLGPEGLASFLLAAAPAEGLVDRLVRGVRGFSPLAAREILARAGLDGTASGRDAVEREGQLVEAFASFLPLLEGRAEAPCVAYAPDGRPLAPWPERPRQWGEGVRLVLHPGPAQAVTAFYAERDRVQRLEGLRSSLVREIVRRRERLALKLARQDEEWRHAGEELVFRRWGELLLAHLGQVAPGATSVEVEDWEAAGEDARVRIPLDPDLSASDNAARLFARYRKARRRRDALGEEMERGRQALRHLEDLEDAARRAEEEAVLEALAAELGAEDRRDPAAAGGPARRRPPPRPIPAFRPLAYRTPGGFVALVGRTGRENDRLSLREAADDDPWFHVAQGPGAHVVLRMATGPPGARPGPDDLLAAAVLAAYHSPQRHGAHVQVDQCAAGRLRKAPGAPPGLVLYDRERGWSVTPDAAVVEAMRLADAQAGGDDAF
ncbi:MAG: NFACT family protein [Firmicutes bacterium]|nr:NFACT family protein [Bacillota bacterium]